MADKDKDKSNPNLGCLEEDDEFEEFPVEGMQNHSETEIAKNSLVPLNSNIILSWFFHTNSKLIHILWHFSNRMGR